MKPGFKSFSALVCLCSLIFPACSLVLNGDVLWVYSAGAEASSGIQMAIQDLSRDWYKVFGVPPTILTDPSQIPANWNYPVLLIGCNASFVAPIRSTWVPAGKEAFAVVGLAAEKKRGNAYISTANSFPAIYVVGYDVRGTIYAIYAFAEEVLGVDPWWYFTDNDPSYVGSISVIDNLQIIESSPVFENRGWFVNDEDLLGGWYCCILRITLTLLLITLFYQEARSLW